MEISGELIWSNASMHCTVHYVKTKNEHNIQEAMDHIHKTQSPYNWVLAISSGDLRPLETTETWYQANRSQVITLVYKDNSESSHVLAKLQTTNQRSCSFESTLKLFSFNGHVIEHTVVVGKKKTVEHFRTYIIKQTDQIIPKSYSHNKGYHWDGIHKCRWQGCRSVTKSYRK